MSETNYELWLSSCQVSRMDLLSLELHVPNAFFQEYLSEHYKEVIQEVLRSEGHPRAVSFVVAPQKRATAPTEPPKTRDTKPEKSAREKLLATIPQQLLDNDTVLLDLEVRREELDKLNPHSTGVANEKANLVTRYWDRVKWIRERLADGTHPWLKGRRLWGTDPYRRHA